METRDLSNDVNWQAKNSGHEIFNISIFVFGNIQYIEYFVFGNIQYINMSSFFQIV